MDSIWDGRILIWEPEKKDYVQKFWHDGWVEYQPKRQGFEVFVIDDRPLFRQGRSTVDQRKTFISCKNFGSLGKIEKDGNMFSFRYIEKEIIHEKIHDTLFELKFEGTKKDVQQFFEKIKETCKVQTKESTLDPYDQKSSSLSYKLRNYTSDEPKPSFVDLKPMLDAYDSQKPTSSQLKIESDTKTKNSGVKTDCETSEICCTSPRNLTITDKTSLVHQKIKLEPGSSRCSRKTKLPTTKNSSGESALKRFCGVCEVELQSDKWKEHVESFQHKKNKYDHKMKLVSGNYKIYEQIKNEVLPEEQEALEDFSRTYLKQQEKYTKMELFKNRERLKYGKWDVEIDPKAYKKAKIYKCEYCAAEVASREALEVHKKDNHKVPSDAGPSTSKKRKLGKWCEFCRMHFSTDEEFKKHENTSEYHYKRIKKAVSDYQVSNVDKYHFSHKIYRIAARRF